jgi:putative endonuclease
MFDTDQTFSRCHPERNGPFAREGAMQSKDLHFCMQDRKTYAVYILASRSLNFYIGVTSNLHKRVWQHKNHTFGAFTADYKIDRLVYYETLGDVRKAILREKQLKGWIRGKKIVLIKSRNPTWLDLSEGWYENAGPSTPLAVRVANDKLRSG